MGCSPSKEEQGDRKSSGAGNAAAKGAGDVQAGSLEEPKSSLRVGESPTVVGVIACNHETEKGVFLKGVSGVVLRSSSLGSIATSDESIIRQYRKALQDVDVSAGMGPQSWSEMKGLLKEAKYKTHQRSLRQQDVETETHQRSLRQQDVETINTWELMAGLEDYDHCNSLLRSTASMSRLERMEDLKMVLPKFRGMKPHSRSAEDKVRASASKSLSMLHKASAKEVKSSSRLRSHRRRKMHEKAGVGSPKNPTNLVNGESSSESVSSGSSLTPESSIHSSISRASPELVISSGCPYTEGDATHATERRRMEQDCIHAEEPGVPSLTRSTEGVRDETLKSFKCHQDYVSPILRDKHVASTSGLQSSNSIMGRNSEISLNSKLISSLERPQHQTSEQERSSLNPAAIYPLKTEHNEGVKPVTRTDVIASPSTEEMTTQIHIKHANVVVMPSGVREIDAEPRDGFLRDFEALCPPNGEGKVVLYYTSLSGVRKTFDDCQRLRAILDRFGVVVDERDVSMDAGFLQELQGVLRKLVGVPRLFVRGRYIGGAEEVLRLHKEGRLREVLVGIPVAADRTRCCVTVEARDLLPASCVNCSGSCVGY